MDMITRRGFIGSLAACGAASALGSSLGKPFEDIRTDRYYTLQGGPYGDTGGWGCPGYELGAELIENMKYWEHCRELEDTIESVEERGFYLSPSTYFEKPWRRFDRIYLTERWMEGTKMGKVITTIVFIVLLLGFLVWCVVNGPESIEWDDVNRDRRT